VTIFAVTSPLPVWTDLDGSPLDNGELYFGTAGQNPATHQVQAYWDAAGTIPAGQPVKTRNGYTVRNGAPAPLYIDGDYSVLGYNKQGLISVNVQSNLLASASAALQAYLATTAGAGGIGLDLAASYAANTIGWGVQISQARIPALKYIPIALWAGLKAGTETSDMGVYINQAITEAAVSGGSVALPPWTLCHSTTITWASRGVSLIGTGVKDGNTLSAPSGTCLKWTGAVGGVQVKVTSGAHQARVEGIMFDANDKADSCLQFYLSGGTSQQIHFPSVSHLRFNGYRGAALVFGNPDTTVLETGQLQIASVYHCSWDGGGATATLANVIGIVLNAQNCEILNCSSLYFDPFTVVGGGPNIDHQSHIVVKTGGLGLHGAVMTRADGYDIDVLGECGLVVDQVRTEDPLFLRMAPGFASNPIEVKNIQGRDGTSTGTEVFISMGAGGGQEVTLRNIRSTGHIQVFTANDNRLTTQNIGFVHSGVSALTRVGGTPRLGAYDMATAPGQRDVCNDNAIETWFNNSDAMMFRNDRGRVRVTSLQGVGAGQDCLNFGSAFTISNTATTATVTFATPEPDVNYRVVCVPNQIVAGAPVAGSGRIASIAKTTTDFTVTVEVAPGAGNSLAYSWLIFRG
jgi:hypothetical protein